MGKGPVTQPWIPEEIERQKVETRVAREESRGPMLLVLSNSK